MAKHTIAYNEIFCKNESMENQITSRAQTNSSKQTMIDAYNYLKERSFMK